MKLRDAHRKAVPDEVAGTLDSVIEGGEKES